VARRDQTPLNTDFLGEGFSRKPRRVSPMQFLGTGIICVVLGVGFGAYNIYQYHVGTPATATDVRCVHVSRNTTCTGTWSVAGNSQNGPILGPGRRDGSTLNVRVRGGAAYTADSGYPQFMLGILMFAVFALLAFVARTRMRPSS
jgi:hypothetical protein